MRSNLKAIAAMAVLLTIAGSSAAPAADPIVFVLDSDKGLYWDGQSSHYVRLVTPEGSPPPVPPIPQPPDPDDPQPPSTFRSEVTEAAEAINDPIGARIMAQGFYGVLADQINNGTIPADADSVDRALTAAKDAVLSRVGSTRDKWQTFHSSVVIPELGERVVGGSVRSKAEYVAFFREVQNGLNDSLEGQAPPVWLQPLIDALIQVLIELLRNLFAGADVSTSLPPPDDWIMFGGQKYVLAG